MEEMELYNYKKKRSTIIFILLFVLMIAVNVVVCVFTLNSKYNLAIAKVVDVGDSQITYEFNISSDKVCRQVCVYEDKVCVGDTIFVYYNKLQPSMVRFGLDKTDIMLIVLSVLTEIIVVLDTIYMFIYYRY